MIRRKRRKRTDTRCSAHAFNSREKMRRNKTTQRKLHVRINRIHRIALFMLERPSSFENPQKSPQLFDSFFSSRISQVGKCEHCFYLCMR